MVLSGILPMALGSSQFVLRFGGREGMIIEIMDAVLDIMPGSTSA